MTRSRRGQRNLGDEYWSRRPLNGYGPSSENKHITHGIERARARQEIMEEIDNLQPLVEEARLVDVRAGLWLLGNMGLYFQPDGVDSEYTINLFREVGKDASWLRTLHYTLMLHGY